MRAFLMMMIGIVASVSWAGVTINGESTTDLAIDAQNATFSAKDAVLVLSDAALSNSVGVLNGLTNTTIKAGEDATTATNATAALSGATNALQIQVTSLMGSTTSIDAAVVSLQGATNALQINTESLQASTNDLNARTIIIEGQTNTFIDGVARVVILEGQTNTFIDGVARVEVLEGQTNTFIDGVARVVILEGQTNAAIKAGTDSAQATNDIASLVAATNYLDTRATALETVTNRYTAKFFANSLTTTQTLAQYVFGILPCNNEVTDTHGIFSTSTFRLTPTRPSWWKFYGFHYDWDTSTAGTENQLLLYVGSASVSNLVYTYYGAKSPANNTVTVLQHPLVWVPATGESYWVTARPLGTGGTTVRPTYYYFAGNEVP